MNEDKKIDQKQDAENSIPQQDAAHTAGDPPQVPSDADGSAIHPGLADDAIIERYGDPVIHTTANGGDSYVSGINEAYWAALYAQEHVVIYEPDEQLFFQYDKDTGIYSVISTDAIKQSVSARLLEASREVDEWDRLERLRYDKMLNAIVSQLKGIVEKRGFFSRTSPIRTVHFANCVLVFWGDHSASQVGFSPGLRSRNRSPIHYDRGAECPRFFKELLEPILHPDDVVLLQKLAGQALLGHNLTQRVLVMDGPAGDGKTQTANVLQEIVGRQNVTQLRTKHLEDRFELSRLLGRTLLVGVDVDPDFLSTKGASVIKGLVGGDWFDAERKGSNSSFQFQGNFNIIMTANSRLRVRLQRDVDAWRRRLIIIRCKGKPPKRKITDFAKVLVREEGAGIVNWALQGLELLLRDITLTGDIVLTPRQKGTVDDLLAESDSMRVFLTSCVDKRRGASGLTVSHIRQEYAEFCADRGWVPMPEARINGALKSLMLEIFQVEQSHDLRVAGSTVRGYRGVEIIPSVP